MPNTGSPTNDELSLRTETSPKADSLHRIRKKYKCTVMSTPHYDSVYAESMVENWAEEFGPELAAWLANDNPVTPQFNTSLFTAANECR